MNIYCCSCEKDIKARLSHGGEIYPHRPDLSNLPFWICDKCKNFVGCHHKTKNRTKPLGCIPTPEIKYLRKKIHSFIDPLWRSGEMTRNDVYQELSNFIGWSFHTAKIKSIDEGLDVLYLAQQLWGCRKTIPSGIVTQSSRKKAKKND